jgi:hypothetical protein
LHAGVVIGHIDKCSPEDLLEDGLPRPTVGFTK